MCFAPNVQRTNLICMFKFEERFEFELAKVLDNPERRKVFSGKVKELTFEWQGRENIYSEARHGEKLLQGKGTIFPWQG